MKIQVDNIEDLGKCGIYCITNILNNKKYIGSTKRTFRRRYIEHKSDLNRQVHINKYLQRSYNKYGKDVFIYTILEVVDKKDVVTREDYYIRLYKTYNSTIGYNLEEGVLDKKVSNITKSKISNTLKEGYKSGRIKLTNNFNSIAGWNRGIKCPNISNTRRSMFNTILVLDINKNHFVTFRSVTDLEEWSKCNKMPNLIITSNNRKGYILRKDKIYNSIRNNKPYKGLYFKLNRPLYPEMDIVNWVNSKNAEMPTLSQAGSTLLEGATTT